MHRFIGRVKAAASSGLSTVAVFVSVTALAACTTEAPLFQLLPSERTGVSFRNEIEEREGLNVLVYEYFYNGGGVAVGDVNGDDLPDLYFSANMGPNALYLNEGNFEFRDITESAGVHGGPGWTTGVTMADVNGDGLLDVYVCRSGRVSEALRRNELFINNGDLTFTERAADFGLDDPSYSTHAVFFDYDVDGDLDAFLLNHPVERYSRFDVDLIRQMRDPLAGDKLFRNDDGRFVDVSQEAGIAANPIGFGLSAVAGDINGDGLPDLYVANDYIEDDYLYINQGDGTFVDEVRARMPIISYSSMGTDVADVDNDGEMDIVTLDMMPEDPVRRKLLQGPSDFRQYRDMLDHGYHRQVMRNMLQLNNGDGTFSEVGQLAGISATDWSWAPLLADFDNDGWKDLYVTNGYLRDYTNMDFLMSVLQPALRVARMRETPIDADSITRRMPQTPVPNYVYGNVDGLRFENRSSAWGVAQASFSNGAAYADLDLDGDLDLVVNNINDEAFLYRNTSANDRHYLRVRLQGPPGNPFGVGARVALRAADGSTFVQEHQPVRGYLSSVEPVLHFGTGSATDVELDVTWPGGRTQTLASVETNRSITLRFVDAERAPNDPPAPSPPTPFVALTDPLGLDFVHRENDFVDFERTPLLPHMLSRLGPALASSDVNSDGLVDVFAGGAHGEPARLYLQQNDGSFRPSDQEAFEQDAIYEDVDATFFDADGDGDADLYVVSGGNWEPLDSTVYQDRLYLNAGFGRFERSHSLPPMYSSGGAVAAEDVDRDGDVDLFVGGRVAPDRYPFAPRSFLLENRGGRFIDVTPNALRTPGMVSAAVWMDFSDDYEGPELILAGEWMPIRVFAISAWRADDLTESSGLSESSGWWNTLHATDLDNDGDLDLVAGNRGLNHFLDADTEHPVSLFAGYFGYDRTADPILTYVVDDKRHPEPWRDELLEQIPRLRRSFPSYASYASATIEDVLGMQWEDAQRFDATEFATCAFENHGGSFIKHPLPLGAQFAPVNDVVTLDVNQDGLVDLVLGGNNYAARPQWGPYSSGRGVLLVNEGGFSFRALSSPQSGLDLRRDLRRLDLVATQLGTLLVAANNDGALEAFGVNYLEVDAPLAIAGTARASSTP